MILDTDKDILDKSEITYLKTIIQNTLLSKFVITDVEPDHRMKLAYKPVLDCYDKTSVVFFADAYSVDTDILNCYNQLKKELEQHYKVSKYVVTDNTGFKYKKIYYFKIENSTTIVRFVLECSGYVSSSNRGEANMAYNEYVLHL